MTIRKSERSTPAPRLAIACAAALGVIAGISLAGAVALREPAANAAPAKAERFAYVGSAGSEASVVRTRDAAGGERLHGETELRLGARTWRRVIEDVAIDARGRLERAEVTTFDERGAGPTARLTLDAVKGEVRLTSAAGAVAWSAPADAPWTYAAEPVAGHPIATPVAAWVAHRAAAVASAVRQIEPASKRAPLVDRAQVAIATEAGMTVVVGGGGADVDELFVAELRSIDYGSTLLRTPKRCRLEM